MCQGLPSIYLSKRPSECIFVFFLYVPKRDIKLKISSYRPLFFSYHLSHDPTNKTIGFILAGKMFWFRQTLLADVTNTGNGERGTGNGERGTGNGEPGTGNRERGTGNWSLVTSVQRQPS